MKQLLIIIGSAILLFSCKSKSAEGAKVLGASNDAEYAEFVKWKEAKEEAKEKNSATTQPVATNQVVKTVVVKQPVASETVTQ